MENMNAFMEIDDCKFYELTSDTSKFDYYVDSGLIIFKEKDCSNFYVMAGNRTVWIRSTKSLSFFVKNHKKFFPPVSMVPQSIFLNTNPYGKDFPENIPSILDELAKKTGIQFGSLGDNPLKYYDSYIAKGVNSSFQNDCFIHLIAVTGEIIRKRHLNCVWKMTLERDGNSWYPDVVYSDHPLSIGVRLYENLNDGWPHPLMRAFYSIEAIIEANIHEVGDENQDW